MNPNITSKYSEVDDIKIHYLVAGKGDPILLIHGFPTSSYLWRNIISDLSKKHLVIAIDLPGYGNSDKNLEDSYSFRYYNRILTGFLDNLKIDQFTLGVHDLGGPLGLSWMVNNMERVERLILFNTLVYPNFSWGVKLFGIASMIPGIRDWLTSPGGIKKTLQIGVYNKEHLTDEIYKKYQTPFSDKTSRKVLLKTVQRLSIKGFKEIEEKLPSYTGPVQIIYGTQDKILPKVESTMKRVKEDLPQSNIIAIPNCGHFLQEEAPVEVSASILKFMEN